jgi:acetate CoA/acetoacetate CoA-transferase alpha subunit
LWPENEYLATKVSSKAAAIVITKPQLTATEAGRVVNHGMTILVPGFLACGTPETLIDALIAAGIKDLTAVCNDSAYPDHGIGKLIRHHCLRRFITTHQGTNPDMKNNLPGTVGGIEVELVPQGTLIERIRAGGAGLGGVLTPTGIGTPVEAGKRKIEVNGRPFLLELPLRGDVALIRAETADRAGNLIYRHTARNYNPVMATAADCVIAEVGQIVDIGELDPDRVETPGVYVDTLVLRE